MQRIHPVTVANCRAHNGKPVLLFLTDGTEMTGVLSRVQDGKLILNGHNAVEPTDKTVTLKKKANNGAKIQAAKKPPSARKAAQSTAAQPFFGPYPQSAYTYGFGEPIAIDVAAVGALFVLG